MKATVRKILTLYPAIFIVVLFIIGFTRYRTLDSGIVTMSRSMENPVPLGAAVSPPQQTPVPFRAEELDGTKYSFVYEKATGKYFVYTGFQCVGVIEFDSDESVEDFSGKELLRRMSPLEKNDEGK
ncbi:MAG: hypothetical protein LBT44_08100 [Clostridiales bacterium]|nr:hypothetical protein [Clostridiales bacterium]